MSALSQAPHQQRPYTELSGGDMVPGATQPSLRTALLPMLLRASRTTWRYLQQGSAVPILRRRQRRMRVSETLSLGDKRFVSILEVDGQSFLLGGSGNSIALLASLAPEQVKPFERVLGDSLQQDGVQ